MRRLYNLSIMAYNKTRSSERAKGETTMKIYIVYTQKKGELIGFTGDAIAFDSFDEAVEHITATTNATKSHHDTWENDEYIYRIVEDTILV